MAQKEKQKVYCCDSIKYNNDCPSSLRSKDDGTTFVRQYITVSMYTDMKKLYIYVVKIYIDKLIYYLRNSSYYYYKIINIYYYKIKIFV